MCNIPSLNEISNETNANVSLHVEYYNGSGIGNGVGSGLNSDSGICMICPLQNSNEIKLTVGIDDL